MFSTRVISISDRNSRSIIARTFKFLFDFFHIGSLLSSPAISELLRHVEIGVSTSDYGAESELFASASDSVKSALSNRQVDEETDERKVTGDPSTTVDQQDITFEALDNQTLERGGGADSAGGPLENSMSDSDATNTTGYASIEGEDYQIY